MLDTLLHRYFKIPYRLYVHTDRRVKKASATVLFLHGMGTSSSAWDGIIDKLPDDVRVISIDLLGFGQSPSPRWLKYSTDVQAKAVIATLLRLKIRKKLIIVGHSMGALVAVEVAKRYPFIVKSLLLCSPPFYSDLQKRTLLPTQTALLKRFYALAQKYPKNIVGMTPLATKLKIIGKSFNVTSDNVDIYMAALQASVLNQTGFEDAIRIRKPTHILYGSLDPIIVKKNLDAIAKRNEFVSVSSVVTGHELIGRYLPAVARAIVAFIPGKK